MAQFLTTTEINSNIEKLIKSAKYELILISPYLKLSSRNRKLLAEQKNRIKEGIHIVYRKDNYVLPPEEMDWLETQNHIHSSTCENLHAKCYLNEDDCIITSLNLLDSSQNNNYEMGVLINKYDDEKLYKETRAEAIKILEKSKKVNNVFLTKLEQKIETGKLAMPKLAQELELVANEHMENTVVINELKTVELAKKLGFSYIAMWEQLEQLGYVEYRDKKRCLTEKGRLAGGKNCSDQSGSYFLWSEKFILKIDKINSVELAKKQGIITNEVIDKLVKSDYLKKEAGRLMFPDKYYLTEKGINIGIEEKETGSIHEARFLYPENIKF